jgi:hypothetical protein
MAFFPAFLCHAAGHVIFLLGANVLLGVSMSLTMYVGRSEMGAHGVAMAWCVVNAMNLILWTASVHRRYFGAVHVAPIIKLIFMPALGSCLVVSLLAFLHCLDWLRADMGFMGRWFVLVQLSVLTGAGLLAGLASLKLLAGRDKKWGIA